MAISKKEALHTGWEKFEWQKELGAKSSLGRPSYLSDAQLTTQRDQLVQFLEGAWGSIGWDLRRAKTPQGVQKALAAVVAGGYQNALMPFLRPTDAAPNPPKARELRRKIGKVNEQSYKAFEEQTRTAEAFQKAQMALSQCSTENLKAVQKEHKKRQQQAKDAAERYAALDQERNTLTAELQDIEAAYAQSELPKMIKTRRYSYTPLNLANGMAGLPYMGWRQSALRCYKLRKKYPCKIANGLGYSIFRIISSVVESVPEKSASRITSKLTKAIPKIRSKRQRYVRDHLADNWFFLKRAIQDACDARPHPKALPFKITAAFQKQMTHQSAEDRVLAEMGKLDLGRLQT